MSSSYHHQYHFQPLVRVSFPNSSHMRRAFSKMDPRAVLVMRPGGSGLCNLRILLLLRSGTSSARAVNSVYRRSI